MKSRSGTGDCHASKYSTALYFRSLNPEIPSDVVVVVVVVVFSH